MPSNALALFDAALSTSERSVVATLTSPTRIQDFLDGLPYRAESEYCCPLRVVRDRLAHCFDGALFAAAMLRHIGHPPLIVNLFAERDDEHLLALFKADGHFGALAKSNFVGLRYREPVYRTLRELVMSYFDDYYNLDGYKSLRSYSVPVNLNAFDRTHWMTSDDHLDRLVARLDAASRVRLLTPGMIRRLSPLDRRSFEAGMLGTDLKGVYRPG